MPGEHEHNLCPTHGAMFKTVLGKQPGEKVPSLRMSFRILCHVEGCDYETFVITAEAFEVQDDEWS